MRHAVSPIRSYANFPYNIILWINGREIGARFNTLATVRDVNQGVELVNDQILSEIRDLDYAEAVSRLSLESFTLEAAQQSYAKISNISLFTYLR